MHKKLTWLLGMAMIVLPAMAPTALADQTIELSPGSSARVQVHVPTIVTCGTERDSGGGRSDTFCVCTNVQGAYIALQLLTIYRGEQKLISEMGRWYGGGSSETCEAKLPQTAACR